MFFLEFHVTFSVVGKTIIHDLKAGKGSALHFQTLGHLPLNEAYRGVPSFDAFSLGTIWRYLTCQYLKHDLGLVSGGVRSKIRVGYTKGKKMILCCGMTTKTSGHLCKARQETIFAFGKRFPCRRGAGFPTAKMVSCLALQRWSRSFLRRSPALRNPMVMFLLLKRDPRL